MAEPLNCETVASRDMIERYVAETLPEAEAEAFEAHYLDCAKCWGDLQAALQLRRTLTSEPASKPHDTSPRAPTGKLGPAWFALAAATVLAVSTGVWWATRAPVIDESVVRGAADAPVVTVAWQSDGSLTVRWTAVPSATQYRVRVSGGSGPGLTREVAAPAVQFSAAELGDAAEAAIVVEAENALGDILGKSRRTPIPRH